MKKWVVHWPLCSPNLNTLEHVKNVANLTEFSAAIPNKYNIVMDNTGTCFLTQLQHMWCSNHYSSKRKKDIIK